MRRGFLTAISLPVFALLISYGQAWAEPGDAAVGRELFTGQRRFANGGAPCATCHRVLGAGGASAPELTKIYYDPGKSHLLNAGWLNNPGFREMEKIYSSRNVTEEEAGHLRAFFEDAGR